MFNKHINLFKSLIAIVLALGVVTVIQSQEVFLGSTPNINPGFVARLQNAPSTIASLPGRTVASIGNFFSDITGAKSREAQKVFAELPHVDAAQLPSGLLFQSISKSAFAAEDTQTGKKYLKLKQGTKVRVTVVTLPDGTQQKKLEILPE